MIITQLKAQAFKSIGHDAIAIDIQAPIALFVGDNSQGKTTIAEAIEFLLTGTVSRRELLGSEVSEFQDSLRNAYVADTVSTFVEARFEHSDDEFIVRRTLQADCTHNRGPTSVVTVNAESVEALDLPGIAGWSPPIAAPVLLQHSIRYLLSARPTERLRYFSALLELRESSDFRDAVGALSVAPMPAHDRDLIDGIRTLAGDPTIETTIARFNVEGAAASDIALSLVRRGAREAGVQIDDDADPQQVADALRQGATDARSATLPLEDLQMPRLSELEVLDGPPVDEYADAQAETSRAVAEILALFEAVLSLEHLPEDGHSIDCPLCETPSALSTSRIAEIRRVVAANSRLSEVQARMTAWIERASDQARRMSSLLQLPTASDWDEHERVRHLETYALLAGDERALEHALDTIADLQQRCASIRELLAGHTGTLQEAQTAVESMQAIESDPNRSLVALREAWAALVVAWNRTGEVTTQCRQIVIGALDEFAVEPRLRNAERVLNRVADIDRVLCEDLARTSARDRLAAAKHDTERAFLTVLDQRYEAMSEEILRWWVLLRPADAATFAGIARRGEGRRSVALQARLNGGGLGALRDAVGVLSDSQLGALGLSAFLARATASSTTLLVLDDPLAGFDDEHRATFAGSTLGALADEGVQILVATCSRPLAEEIEASHSHRGIDRFDVVLESPELGTSVRPSGDVFERHWSRAKGLSRSGDPQNRKVAAGAARDAAERLAKQLLVAYTRRSGSRCTIVDFEGIVLSQLMDRLAPHVATADELGKWRSISTTMNPGSHDADAPPANAITQAVGYLRSIKNNHREVLGTDWVPNPED